ncbi:hypothetical protein ACWKWU_10710 [Chitinophaga lutea]
MQRILIAAIALALFSCKKNRNPASLPAPFEGHRPGGVNYAGTYAHINNGTDTFRKATVYLSFYVDTYFGTCDSAKWMLFMPEMQNNWERRSNTEWRLRDFIMYSSSSQTSLFDVRRTNDSLVLINKSGEHHLRLKRW